MFRLIKCNALLLLLCLLACPANAQQRPNIVLILADDMGYSDLGSYGGEVNTPNINKLAEGGIKYRQFYNAARCCPTRASLMTGLYPHQAGMGWMAAADLGTPPYQGSLNNQCVTIAEVLKNAGYDTYMTGKWHLTNERKINGMVTDTWPKQRGFDRYFGIIPGGANYFTPTVYSNNKRYPAPPDFYLTDAISDTTVQYIEDHFSSKENNPMFMYVAYTSPHWPLHALEKDIKKYKGQYKAGWDRLRQARFERQKQLGVIPNGTLLSPRDPAIEPWDSLSDEQQNEMAMRLAIYAAQIDIMDQGIGRIVQKLREKDQLENTLILFLSDNGACAEFISSGKSKEVTGKKDTFESYRIHWANVSSTPFREYKHYTYEGGIATPLIAHWPGGIDKKLNNTFINEYGHVSDIMPTCVEIANAKYPERNKNHAITPLVGKSLAPHFRGQSNNRGVIYWEHEANIAMRDGKWKLVAKTSEGAEFSKKSLELFDMAKDPSEMNNLAAQYPERVNNMYEAWFKWANNIGAFPLDTRNYGVRMDAYKKSREVTATVHSQGQKINPMRMKTTWGEQVTPENAWRQYPRPQMVRSMWMNVNGLWDYAIVPKNASQPGKFDGKILVPFCAESTLSGVGKMVQPDQKLWYNTTFVVPDNWKGKQVLLHFDAVDWEATVWLNGKEVGGHKGGSDPFSFDITRYLKKGLQELVVSVWDPTDTGTQSRGKQVLEPKGIWYTPVTGIWQTVWLEPVERTHIESIVAVSDIDRNKVVIKSQLSAANGKETLIVKVLKDNQIVAEKTAPANGAVEISIPNPELWTPYHPALYHLDIQLTDGRKTLDKVKSYFAMRKIAVGKDATGFERLMLNNEPVFQYGTLDQGWWPDGLLTPPSEVAMRYDMEVLKDMGFNMLRKHIKVEPSRYYYYADSLGLLIWQDMVSGFNSSERETQHVKPQAKKDWNRPEASAQQFEKEWKSIMDHLRFFPSIVVWVVFNEGWGQYDTKRIVEWTRQYDSTRVINGVSGWTDRGVGQINDAHQYPGPAMEPPEQNPGRVIVLGEFGGLGLPVENHIWNPNMRNWGYRTYQTTENLIKEYTRLIYNLHPMIHRGLAAAVYTQTTDVEGEVNGLITYDRKKIKMDPELLRMLHGPLYNTPRKSTVILHDSEVSPQNFLITDKEPIRSETGQLDKSGFSSMAGPIMLEKGDKRCAVRSFNLNQVPDNLQLRILAHGDAKMYLNGQLVIRKFINTKRHYDEINLSAHAGYLKQGENNLLIELDKVVDASAFDFGLYTF